MRRIISVLAVAALTAATMIGALSIAFADTIAQALPFSQVWSNTGLITTDDDWSGVPAIIGYRGDNLTMAPGTNPQTITVDGSATPVDVNANRSDPNTFTQGGATEFELANPVVALQSSGTADAPHIVINLDTTGQTSIKIAYLLRDIDGSSDNAAEPVALQYRVGSQGDYTNVPTGFVADATTGPSAATLVTPVNVTLPADADNQSLVQVRIITADAAGTDEWVGVDDISITSAQTTNPPDAVDDPASVVEDSDFTQIDVLSNDTSAPDTGETLTVTALGSTSNGGTAEFTGGGTGVRYKPAPNFFGTETFTYTVSDGNGGEDTATVTVQVSPVNDPPVADKDSYKGKEDKTLNIGAPGVLSGDTDPEGAALRARPLSGPSNGKLKLNANGSFTYTPKKDFNGTDSFTYRACETANPTVCSAPPAKVTIKVKPVPG